MVDADPNAMGTQRDPDLVNDPGNNPAIANPNVTATGYTSSFPGTTRTQLYGIDTGDDSVVEFETPTPTFENVTRVSPLGIDATDGAELDISSRNRSLAVLRVGTAASKLYQVDINATANPLQDIGTIGGDAADRVEELAIAPRLRSFVALTDGSPGSPQQLVRFRSDRPEAASAGVNITGLPGGTTLVGIDTRNENGVLYGVGSNSRLYALDQDTGAAAVVGSGPFSPVLNGTAFGVDFNPVPDRLRVVSDNEQNKRLNPDTGQSGVNPPASNADDAALTPAGNVVGSAYTNPKADAQNTTLFGIDSAANQLVMQGGPDGSPSPNGGTLTNVGTTLGPDVDNKLGYDIVPEFNQGFIATDDTSTMAAESNLYSVNSVQSGMPPSGPGSAVLIGELNLPAGRLASGLAFLNDDVLSLGSSSISVDENGGNASVTVLRSGDAQAAVSATVTLAPGSATGADYGAPTPATVSFAPGETVKTVTIPITNDAADEPNESFAVSLRSPTNGAGIGRPSDAKVTIQDDDQTPPSGGGGGTNVINGTGGNDTINGTSGNDVINCGDGNDVVNGGGGDDLINCGRGNDRTRGGSGDDRISGESGNDRIDGGSGNDRIRGGSGNDRIAGSSGDDRIFGDSGNDRISGGTGDDRISGGSGNDQITGGNGKDRLAGDAGRDRVSGGDGNDRVAGGAGNDRVRGDSGRDRVSGGSGRDSVRQ